MCVCVCECVSVCVCVTEILIYLDLWNKYKIFFSIFFLKKGKMIIIFERELKVKTAPPLFPALGPTLNDSDDVIKENQAEIERRRYST